MSHVLVFILLIGSAHGFLNQYVQTRLATNAKPVLPVQSANALFEPSLGHRLVKRRHAPLRDILGLGPAEIAVTLVVGLVLFGPETLKSLSKDVGKAAAELKEIPKTFKEGKGSSEPLRCVE